MLMPLMPNGSNTLASGERSSSILAYILAKKLLNGFHLLSSEGSLESIVIKSIIEARFSSSEAS